MNEKHEISIVVSRNEMAEFFLSADSSFYNQVVFLSSSLKDIVKILIQTQK